MFTKKALIVLLLVAIFLGPVAPSVSAAAVTPSESRVQVLVQIQKLLAEVLRLQEILKARGFVALEYTPYQSVFFPLSFETVYLVKNGNLVNVKKGGVVRTVDQQLFNLFTSVIGEEAVKKHVKEWRVFQNDSNDLGAFVELIAGSEDWIVGVNRDSYDANDEQIVVSFVNLFVHEYAHILLFNKPEFETTFKNTFWTSSDLAHQAKVERVSANSRFTVMSHYFDNNPTRFVSDYATMNADEDMAETFLTFILEDKPTGTSIKDKKILSFYKESDLVKLRTQLRANLSLLNAL
jgi:Putative zinc-binding metallo-peptidase